MVQENKQDISANKEEKRYYLTKTLSNLYQEINFNEENKKQVPLSEN